MIRVFVFLILTLTCLNNEATADGLRADSRGSPYTRPRVWAFYGYDPSYPKNFDFSYSIPVIGRFLPKLVEADLQSRLMGKDRLVPPESTEATYALRTTRIRIQVLSGGRVLGSCFPSGLEFSKNWPGTNNYDLSGVLKFGADVSWVGINNGKPSQEDRGRCLIDGTRRRFAPAPALGDEIRLVYGARGKILAKARFVRNNK